MTKGILIIAMLVLFTVGVGVANADGPSIDICTTNPDVCANRDSATLVVYEGTDASVNPGLYAHFANWITNPATPGSIWVVDTVAHDGNIAGKTDYGSVPVSINSNPKDALYGWTPDGTGVARYKVYAHATQDPEVPGLFADVTVRTRTNSVPELPTSALLSVGLIGLIGMVKLKRRN